MTVYLLERKIPWTQDTYVAVGVYGSDEEIKKASECIYADLRTRKFNINTQKELFD